MRPFKNIKVAFLLGSLNRGGTETLVLDIFNSHQTYFNKICIYRSEGDLTKEYHSLRTHLNRISPGSLCLLWLYLWKLRKLLIREGVSIVHSHQRIDTIYARLACFGLPISVIQTIHEFDFNKSKLSKFLIRFSFILAERNLFVSNFQKNYYISKYKSFLNSQLIVVYNGISLEKFHFQDELSLRIEYNLSDKCLLLGMVGNFVPGHDQMTICRFLALLALQGIEFKFLFVGGKDMKNPHLFHDCILFCQDNGLSDRCFFLGSRSDVPIILSQLNAFFYSSDHDAFGISLIEAIAAGPPVFVNDWDVIKEITENGERAILYRSKDEYDLLKKFTIFNSNSESFKLKAKENAIWAHNTFSIENHLKKLYSIYAEI